MFLSIKLFFFFLVKSFYVCDKLEFGKLYTWRRSMLYCPHIYIYMCVCVCVRERFEAWVLHCSSFGSTSLLSNIGSPSCLLEIKWRGYHLLLLLSFSSLPWSLSLKSMWVFLCHPLSQKNIFTWKRTKDKKKYWKSLTS